jgi:hypothetical protein
MPTDTPIISREALLSLVEWVKMWRQKHEQSMSRDSGTSPDHSGGAQTPSHDSVRTNDPSVSDRTREQPGDHHEKGA